MHRVLVSTARLCLAAGSGRGPPAAFRGAALRPTPRSLVAASRRYYHVSAIATPFPGLQPALPDAATPARRWGSPSRSLRDRLAALWQLYLTSLARRPLLTKACTSFVCVCIGDSIAQAIGGKPWAAAEAATGPRVLHCWRHRCPAHSPLRCSHPPTHAGAPYSIIRVLRLAAYSSTVGACCGHHWHRWLETAIHPEAPQSHAAVRKSLKPVAEAATHSAWETCLTPCCSRSATPACCAPYTQALPLPAAIILPSALLLHAGGEEDCTGPAGAE